EVADEVARGIDVLGNILFESISVHLYPLCLVGSLGHRFVLRHGPPFGPLRLPVKFAGKWHGFFRAICHASRKRALDIFSIFSYINIFILNLPSPNSCVLGVGTRTRCVLRRMSLSSPRPKEAFLPRNLRGPPNCFSRTRRCCHS